MLTIPRNAKQLALASLVASVSIWGASAAQAQTLPAIPTDPPPVVREQGSKDGLFLIPGITTAADAPPTPLPDAAKAPAADPAPCADGACDAAPSVWAKVPPPVKFPRLGAFFIPPTGEGYYSLKDVITGNFRETPPVNPWPAFGFDLVPFYDNNFRYLDNPDNTQHDCLDPIKRIHLGDNFLLSLGGEERIRFNDEQDSRLGGHNNIFESIRTRVYGDLWYRDMFRFYVEFEDSQTENERLAASPSDLNKSDLLNFFADVKVFELDDHAAYIRGGRQELNYGSQRLISQTDFPNASRNFDGVKGFWHNDTIEVDAFWTRPVVINPTDFDSENDKATFAGLWGKYRPAKDQSIDLYYLYLDNATPLAVAAGSPLGGRRGFDTDTFGLRYAGEKSILVWDFEGMYQCGEHTFQTTSAGAATTGAGIHLADVPMSPVFWIYYDFASGSHNPGHGDYGTFNQLYPNGHNYFGWTDLVGRQNIEDLNFQTWFYPAKWITLGVQYHILDLDSAKDALYNAAGAVERVDPTGKSGVDVGQVITGVANFHLSMHSDLLLQFSRFDSGTFVKDTGSPLSPDFFYVQYTFRW